MPKEPIFELMRSKESDDEWVRIYVTYNGRRMPLIDALKIIEKPFVEEGVAPGDYAWHMPDSLYGMIVRHRDGTDPLYEYFHPLRKRILFVKSVETEEHVIWKVAIRKVLYTPTRVFKEITAEDGLVPKYFREFPIYPDFVFNRKQFDEELEIMRPAYEKQRQKEALVAEEFGRIRKLNAEWDAETVKNDPIDYASLTCPRHEGPIFEFAEEDGRSVVKIFVDYEGKRMPLVEVLNIWNESFEESKPDELGWLGVIDFYDSMVLQREETKPFLIVLSCSGCHGWPCAAFRVQVRETDDLVIWSNFRYPQHNKYSRCGYWDYSGYPPFVFDKKQYDAGLEALRPEYEKQKEENAQWLKEHPEVFVSELGIIQESKE